MTEVLQDLERLAGIPAPSGREAAITEVIRESWSPFGQVNEDRLGNLHVTVGTGGRHVAFVAHQDELGFVVRAIDGDGFVGLNRLGGIPERVLAGQRILLLGRKGLVEGVFATYPHHLTPDSEKYRVKPITEAWVDIGARTREDAVERLGVRVGDFGVYARSWHVSGDTLFANAIDDRVGLAVLTAMLRRIGQPNDARVTAIASVQEEFSVRALVPTVRHLRPDALVVVDVSPATDTPWMRDHSDVRLGGGPVLHLHSFHGRGTLGGVLPPEWLVEAAERSAELAGTSLQRASVVGVITDGAFAMHLNDGIPTIEVGIAVRYTHAPVEACSLDDIDRLADLLCAMALEVPSCLQRRWQG